LKCQKRCSLPASAGKIVTLPHQEQEAVGEACHRQYSFIGPQPGGLVCVLRPQKMPHPRLNARCQHTISPHLLWVRKLYHDIRDAILFSYSYIGGLVHAGNSKVPI
jgi:hypothetical protein